MKRSLAAVAAILTVAVFAGSATLRQHDITRPDSSPTVAGAFGKSPLVFEPNRGQADPSVRFVSHAGRSTLGLTSTGAVLALPGGSASTAPGSLSRPARSDLLGMTFVGSNPSPAVAGSDRLSGVSNYFIGNDPSRWRTHVPHFGSVIYRDLYPGIDTRFHGNQRGRLEYDFTVSPGADPSSIRIGMHGADGIHLDGAGNLVMDLAGQIIVEPRPSIYQLIDGARRGVEGGYTLQASRVGFAVGSFDGTSPLVIDPEVEYSTFLGGSGDEIAEIHPAVDSSGDFFVCGITDSMDFPTTPGVIQPSLKGSFDGYITEMSADGSSVVSSTFLGGTGFDDAQACLVDGEDNVYVGGFTTSADFPVTPGAFQPTLEGGPSDGFVAKIAPGEPSLIYSTFLGGTGDENLNGIQINAAGDAFVAGDTFSTDFPTTPGAYQTSNAEGEGVQCPGLRTPKQCNDEFVTKLNPTGTALLYSTYLGGRGSECCQPGLAVDSQGDAYLEGSTSSHSFPTTRGALQPRFAGGLTDTFVTKLNPTGSAIVYSTYLGGSGVDLGGLGIAVDGSGDAYVSGLTCSQNFPVTPGVFQPEYAGPHSSIFRVCGDGFVSKINPGGSALAYSTYLGGSSSWDYSGGPLVDPMGHAYIPGITVSTDFPVTADAFQSTNHGEVDGTVTELSADGSALLFSTYWGGSGNDQANGIALDVSGNLYVAGCTESSDFPTTPGAFQTTFHGGDGTLGFGVCSGPDDAFATKMAFGS